MHIPLNVKVYFVRTVLRGAPITVVFKHTHAGRAMAIKTDAIRTHIVDTVRAEVEAVTPNNDRVSLREKEQLAPELQTSERYARLGKEGATPTVEDVANNYASYFDRVNTAVNQRGPQVLSLPEIRKVSNNALQVRMVQARAELESDQPIAIQPSMTREARLACIRDNTARRNDIEWEQLLFDARDPLTRTDHRVLKHKIEALLAWAADNLYAEQIEVGQTVREALYDDLGGISLEALADNRGRLLGYELTFSYYQGERGTTYLFDKWGRQIDEQSADV